MQNVNFKFNLAFLSHFVIKNETFAISRAISDVIHEILVKENLKFDIFIVGKDTRQLDEIAKEILTSNNANFSYKIRKKIDLSNTADIKQSSVFLLGPNE